LRKISILIYFIIKQYEGEEDRKLSLIFKILLNAINIAIIILLGDKKKRDITIFVKKLLID
jgi:hypothetical protein